MILFLSGSWFGLRRFVPSDLKRKDVTRQLRNGVGIRKFRLRFHAVRLIQVFAGDSMLSCDGRYSFHRLAVDLTFFESVGQPRFPSSADFILTKSFWCLFFEREGHGPDGDGYLVASDNDVFSILWPSLGSW